MGLDISLYDGSEAIHEKSELHPEHYCNKGYLRSSYNNNGFNSIAMNILGKEMHYIFDPIDGEEDEDGWYVHPVYPKEHLKGALGRAIEVRDALKNALPFKVASYTGVSIFDKGNFEPVRLITSFDAYQAFKAKWEKQGTSFDAEEFEFFNQESLPIHACIQGISENDEVAIHVVSKLWNEAIVQSFAVSLPNKMEKPEKTASKEGVLSIFEDHEKDNCGSSNYSCYDGSFYLKTPLEAHGIIAGCDGFKKPALHIIHKVPVEYFNYYKQQADIIVEFIEKALTLDHPRIVWSA